VTEVSNERPTNAIGNCMFDMPGGVRLNVWLAGGVEDMVGLIDGVVAAVSMSSLAVMPEVEDEEHPEPKRRGVAPNRDARRTSAGTGVWCPDHNEECRKSDPKFDRDGDRWYHALDQSDWYQTSTGATAKNHTLYWRQTVDSNGESNNGQEQPPANPRGPARRDSDNYNDAF